MTLWELRQRIESATPVWLLILIGVASIIAPLLLRSRFFADRARRHQHNDSASERKR